MPDVPALAGTTVSSQNATNLKPDYSKVLTLDFENEFPFTTFMGQVKQEQATGSQFNFFVGRRIPRQTTNSGGVTQGAAGAVKTCTVATGYGQYFSVGDLIYAPASTFNGSLTNRLIVSAIAGDALTVYPNDLSKGIAAITSGDTLYRFSASIKEGSSGRAPIQTVPTLYTQNIQTFEDYGRVNMQVQDSETWTVEKEIARVQREKRIEHVQNMESSYFLADGSLDTTVLGSTANPRYSQKGLLTLLTTNSYSYGTSMTQEGLYNFVSTVQKPAYAPGNTRLVFASIGCMSALNKLFVSALRIQPAEGMMAWKVNFTQINWLGFTWKFILVPTLSLYLDGYGFVLHPNCVSRKVLHETEFKRNVANPKDNFIEPGWVSCNAIKLALEEAQGIIKP